MQLFLSLLPLLAGLAAASPRTKIPPPGADGKYTLVAPGIRAQFIPYAATITNIFVKGKDGIERDIVLGYDDTDYYPVDPNHSDYNAVPGRYTNRIGNATFTIDGITYNTPKNDGENTLHSGKNGWSYRFFTVTAYNSKSITFSIDDPAFSTGMPGRVLASVTYSVVPGALNIKMSAISPEKKTPIMLTQHTYWNLDGFQNPATDLIWDHTLYTPFSRRHLEPDPNMVPTGAIPSIPKHDINDFWSSPKLLGANRTSPQWVGNCGTGSGCAGYNNLWVVDKPRGVNKPVAVLASKWSGIAVEYHTDLPGVQVYSCYWMNGAIEIKKTQGLPGGDGNVKSGGCVAIEAQDWSDGINHPEWGRIRNQIFGPGDRYRWETTYKFKTV